MSRNNPFMSKSGVFPALENGDLNVTVNAEMSDEQEDEVVEDLDTSSTPEAAELDTAVAKEESDEIAEEGEQIDDAVQTLESIKLTLEDMQASNESLTVNSAKLMHTAIEAATSKFAGVKSATDIGVPSVESLANSFNGVDAALEGVKDAIKNGAKAVVDFLKKLYNTIVDFIRSYFTSTGAALRKLNKVKEVASKHNGELAKVENKNFHEGEIDVADSVNALAMYGVKVFNKVTVELPAQLSKLDTSAGKNEKDNKVLAEFQEIADTFAMLGGVDVKEAKLFGGFQLVKEGDVVVFKQNTDKAMAKEVSFGSAAEIATLANDLIGTVNTIEGNNKKALGTIKKGFDILIKRANADENATPELKKANAAARKAMKELLATYKAVLSAQVSMANQFANLAAKALKVKGAEGSEEAKAAAATESMKHYF